VTLPITRKSELDYLWPVDWLGLHQQYLNSGEMEILAALLRQVEAKSVVEIGCRDGRTARVLLHNVTALQRYVGVDVPMSYVPTLDHQRSEMVHEPGALAFVDPRFELVLRENGSLDLMPTEFGPIDAVFIDGDHSERVVEHDSRMAYAFAQKLIVWHDYHENPVVEIKPVLDRLHDKEEWPIKRIEGTWLAYVIR